MTSMPDDANVYGMEVSKLQSGVTVDSENILHGALHYVKNYDGYAKGAEGNFVALRLTAPADAEVTYKTDAVPNGKLTPDDRLMVWKVPSTDKSLSITVKRGEETVTTEYKASGLILEPAPVS